MNKANIIDLLSEKMLGEKTLHLDFNAEAKAKSFLLKQIDSINMQGRDGRTLLIHASLYNYPGLVDFLINHKADLNIQDHTGKTALHGAVLSGNIEIVEELLEHGANPNIQDKYGNNTSCNAYRNPKILCLLIRYGCDITHKNAYGISTLDTIRMTIPELEEEIGISETNPTEKVM